MTSARQLAANRRNALLSTGPRTTGGKLASRSNALRHGLTAQTLISELESGREYEDFRSAIRSTYPARSPVEEELVERLASLLWRLRRASAVETGLFRIQAQNLRQRRSSQPGGTPLSLRHDTVQLLLTSARNTATPRDVPAVIQQIKPGRPRLSRRSGTVELARCFLRIANLNRGAFELIGRYEACLWRQAAQVLFLLGTSRSPQRP